MGITEKCIFIGLSILITLNLLNYLYDKWNEKKKGNEQDVEEDNKKNKSAIEDEAKQQRRRERLIAELEKSKSYGYLECPEDLTQLTIEEIEKHLEAALPYLLQRHRQERYEFFKKYHLDYRCAKPVIETPTITINQPIKEACNNKKDWEKYREYLLRNNITCFYHFTDLSNIESIKANGGLYSWRYCVDNGIVIPKAGGGELSRSLDTRYHLENYVRLSFCSDHPMVYRLKQSGYSLVLLKIKIDVAWFEETVFADMNATDSAHHHGKEFEDLECVDISATQERYVPTTSPNFKKHQAEVLVKRFVPLEYIININNPIRL